MRLLFVHDVKSKRYKNKTFARSYGYDIWKERYLPSFESITVCCRSEKVTNDLEGKMDLSSGPNVTFENRIGMFKGPEVFISRRIKDIINENLNCCDAVIVRLDSFLGLQTIRECKKRNKPYMIELVGCAWDSFWNHGIQGKILAPYLFLRTRNEVRTAPFVVYVTNEFLQKRYPTNGKNTNISNVKIARQSDQILLERIGKIDASASNIVLGTAANVDIRYKGQQYVIEALGRLKKIGNTKFEYHILGTGDQTYLRNIAKKYDVENQVKFLGSFPHDKVFEWLKNDIDLYIQPSLQEGLPRSVIEAMGVGVPCIGSDVAGIPELLSPRMIFKRKRNIVNNIIKLLCSLNKELLKTEAEKNFIKAQEYDYTLLLKKRKEFLQNYIESVNDL